MGTGSSMVEVPSLKKRLLQNISEQHLISATETQEAETLPKTESATALETKSKDPKRLPTIYSIAREHLKPQYHQACQGQLLAKDRMKLCFCAQTSNGNE